MARRKKPRKSSRFKPRIPLPGLPNIEVPDSAKRLTLSVVLFTLAVIFLFAFFEKAGAAGQLFFGAGGFLIGNAVFLLPLFLLMAGLVLFGMEDWKPTPVLLAFALLSVAVSGMIGAFADSQGLDVRELGGLFGFLASWPLMTAFGFWVAEIILGAAALVAAVIFWQLLPHNGKEEEESLGSRAQERIKKIFEPKFEVKEVEPEPKVQAPAEEEKEEEEEEKPEKAPAKAKPIAEPVLGNYKLPPVNLLDADKGMPSAGDIRTYSAVIKKTFQNFDIPVEVSEVNIGPAVTQYAIKPAEGIKLARITALSNDLALALAAHPIRMEAPIPGRALLGIEIPNKERSTVRLRTLVEHPKFKQSATPLNLCLGRDVSGNAVFADLGRMPHLLVAGATGSGKTIALNNIILSLIYQNSPNTLRFVLVDPKRVEFPVYNELPHLLTPVIFDTQRTLNALKWLIKEMERRFEVLSRSKARNIGKYHELLAEHRVKAGKKNNEEAKEEWENMPYIVVVIDELADLMAARGKEMEAMIVRLAQMARAVGIHLVLATQRPSVEVITGLIKANITARVAFQVASQVDSRTILDMAGAEKLLGQGDMLFLSSDFSKPRRIQGAYVSDKEVRKVVEWIEKEAQDFVREEISEEELAHAAQQGLELNGFGDEEDDPMYEQARQVVLETKKASASFLQRRLRLGYARAARLIDLLEERGVIGPADGAKPREVYGASEPPGGEEEEDSEWYSPRM